MTKQRMDKIRKICVDNEVKISDIKELVDCYRKLRKNQEWQKNQDIIYALMVISETTKNIRVKKRVRRAFTEISVVSPDK